MPKGPNGERRPADVIGAAVMVGKIATGEILEAEGAQPARFRNGNERRRDMNTACDQLAALYQKKAAGGLIDVKFFVRGMDDVSKEAICAEALAFDAAVERGDVAPLDFKDRK